MNSRFQGPITDMAIATMTVLIINILEERKNSEDSLTIDECIRFLDDFLYVFAGLANDDLDNDGCDDFLKKCGYRAPK